MAAVVVAVLAVAVGVAALRASDHNETAATNSSTTATEVSSSATAPPNATTPTTPATTRVAPPPPHATTPATTAAGPGSQTVVVTDADDGKAYTLRRGDRLVAQLSNQNVWTEPDASNAAVLSRTNGSTNSDGSAQATFAATGDGQTAVSAAGRSHPLPCETATPRCMVPDHVVAFQVHVSVVG